MPTAFRQVADNAISTTATNLSATGVTSITLHSGDGTKFPQPGNGFYVTLWNGTLFPFDPSLDPYMEKVLVSARSGDILTIAPTTKTHTGKTTVAVLDVAQNTTDLQTAVNTLESTIVHNTGDETISGTKTLTSAAILNAGASMFGALRMRAVTGTPSSVPLGRTGALDTGISVLSSFDGGEDSGQPGTFDSTGRINLYSYQRADVGSFGENLRHFLMKGNAKSMDAWYVPKSLYDGNNDPVTTTGWTPVAWTGAHYKPNNPGNLHAHWELEIPDANLRLQGRLLVPFADDNPSSGTYGQLGRAKTNIRTNLADLSIDAASGVLRVAGSPGTNDRVLEFSNDVLYGSSGSVRWRILANNSSESGSNVGSDFSIRRYADDGTFLGTPIFVQRSTGNVALGQGSAESARVAAIFSGIHGFYAKPSAALTSTSAFSSLLTASTDRHMEIKVSGDANSRLLIDGNGQISWGDGTNARDANLYRNSAGALKTDGSLEIGTTLKVDGNATLGTIVDTNGNTILTLSPITSAVNSVTILNAATGTDPVLQATGSDTTVNLVLRSQSTNGAIKLQDSGGHSILQAITTSSPANYIQVQSANSGAAVGIIAGGTDTNVSINMQPKGTGMLQVNGVNALTLSNTASLTNKTFDTAGTGNVFKINGTQITAVTGGGSAVLATSPTLTTPTLGVATATSINKVTLTTPATGSTLTIADGKTLTVNNSLTFAGTDSTTLTFPTVSSNIQAQVKTGIAKISGGATQFGMPGTQFFNVGTSSLGANAIRYVPFRCPYNVTITAWQFEVTTGPSGAANARVGIYAADTNMQPTGAPIYDSGAVAVASGFTGIKSASSLSISLTPGMYLVCANVDTAMTLRTITATSWILGTAMGTSPMVQRFDATQSFGAFPSTPTAWTSTNTSAGGLQHFLEFQWTE